MTTRKLVAIAALWLACSSLVAEASGELPKGVVCLLEENARELLPKLTNPQGDSGDGEEERTVTFAGHSAVKITRYQKYCNLIPGWAYGIRENPQEGEYRFLRFAWKSDGLTGIMLQLHDDKDWNIRYTAGANKFGWETKFVVDTPPGEWTVVTVDLFKDFGEREIHGIALTAFDGTAGYFDHIYLARTREELDSIDATDGNAETLGPDAIEKHWQQLISPDASKAYRSFWALIAAGESARPILRAKLGSFTESADEETIRRWLVELDSDAFDVRETATDQLSLHIERCRPLLQAELEKTSSAEVRFRLSRLLEKATEPMSDIESQKLQTQRIVRLIEQRATR